MGTSRRRTKGQRQREEQKWSAFRAQPDKEWLFAPARCIRSVFNVSFSYRFTSSHLTQICSMYAGVHSSPPGRHVQPVFGCETAFPLRLSRHISLRALSHGQVQLLTIVQGNTWHRGILEWQFPATRDNSPRRFCQFTGERRAIIGSLTFLRWLHFLEY